MTPWISVKEELPRTRVCLLVTDGEFVTLAWHLEGAEWDSIMDLPIDTDKITHWMYRPEPPS